MPDSFTFSDYVKMAVNLLTEKSLCDYNRKDDLVSHTDENWDGEKEITHQLVYILHILKQLSLHVFFIHNK